MPTLCQAETALKSGKKKKKALQKEKNEYSGRKCEIFESNHTKVKCWSWVVVLEVTFPYTSL